MRMGKRATLFVAAALLVTVLAVLPWSGWLVRLQLRVASGGSLPHLASGHNPTAKERTRAIQTAAAHPCDFPLQLAAAFQSRPGIGSPVDFSKPSAYLAPSAESKATQAARVLWGMRDRFPNSPSLYANTLRLLTADAVRIHRESDIAELEPKTDAAAQKYSTIWSWAYLDTFDEAAATG